MVRVMLLINGKTQESRRRRARAEGREGQSAKGFCDDDPGAALGDRAEGGRGAAEEAGLGIRGQGTVICSACGQSVKVEIEPDDLSELLPIER